MGAPTQMVSGDAAGVWHLWDIRQASPAFQVCEHESAVASLAVRGHRVLSASLDGCVILWDMRAGPKPLQEVDVQTLSGDYAEVWDDGVKQLPLIESVPVAFAG